MLRIKYDELHVVLRGEVVLLPGAVPQHGLDVPGAVPAQRVVAGEAVIPAVSYRISPQGGKLSFFRGFWAI